MPAKPIHLGALFAAKTVPEETPSVPDVPRALTALAVSYAELITHAYGIEDISTIPQVSEDEEYMICFDVAEKEATGLKTFLKDARAIKELFVVDDENFIYAMDMDSLLTGYRKIAEKKNVSLDPPAMKTDFMSLQWLNPALRKDILDIIEETPECLRYLHHENGYPGLDHLALYMRHILMGDAENYYAPSYSYSHLQQIVRMHNPSRPATSYETVKCVH